MKPILKNSLVSNKQRDLKEFEAIALPIMNQLYCSALRLTRNPSDAEDLLQDAYLRAWRFLYRFELGSNFLAWMMRIMMNTHINEYNKKKRWRFTSDFEKTCETFVDEDPKEMDRHDALDSKLDYNDIFDDRISSALDKLPDQYRMVILLADVNDFKYKEIAEILKCPIGSVMSRLHRGRRRMAEFLKPYAEENGYVTAIEP